MNAARCSALSEARQLALKFSPRTSYHLHLHSAAVRSGDSRRGVKSEQLRSALRDAKSGVYRSVVAPEGAIPDAQLQRVKALQFHRAIVRGFFRAQLGQLLHRTLHGAHRARSARVLQLLGYRFVCRARLAKLDSAKLFLLSG
jgi:hypothetical protein